MTMRWEELTAADFPRAAEAARGVCIVPIGVLEKHGNHLPFGTDGLFGQAIADLATTKEPAIVFPVYYFGQIHEAKHWPGAIALRHELMFDLLENLCEEISRNGLHKIVLLNAHGGNESFLPYFCQMMLEKPRDFSLYVIRLADYFHAAIDTPEWKAMMESEFDEHGGEAETSGFMAMYPELVKMAQLTAPGNPLKRQQHIPHVTTSVTWYANFPDHYAGDAIHATPEKGRFLVEHFVDRVAEILKSIKEDTVTSELEAEFWSRVRH